MESSVSGGEENKDGRRKMTKKEVLVDVGVSEAVGADNGSKKEKRKMNKNSGIGEEEKNDGKKMRKHHRGEGDGKGVLEVLGSEVLDDGSVPEVESTDTRSKKKKKRKKDKNIVTAEDQKKKKKSKHSRVRGDSEGTLNVLESSKAEVLGDISVPEIGITDSVSKKKKKKDKKMGITEDQKSPEKKRSVSSDAIASLAIGKDRAFGTSGKSNLKKKSKKVRFAEDVEVFNLSENLNEEELQHKNKKKSSDSLIRGKRFSREEDEIIRKAVLKYVEDHQLGDEGLQMVMKCKEHKELKDCWKKIAEALPSRPYEAVYYRAHILFERAESRKWTEEELDLVREYHAKHGSNWRAVGDELGKHRVHVKDAYRRIKLANQKKGHWSQQEYQALFDLVNTDLQMKAFMDKKLKHGMLRDNISWKEISNKLSTRTEPRCCLKWYDQLCSPLVKEQKWADTDDYRLMTALAELDASCEEDVDWDSLLEHRSGNVCRKRWSEMVRHIGEHGLKSFSDQVDTLSQRYCPDLLEVREAYASKPAVD